ncbi:MAG: energy-coupling factor transporter transmembrane component T [Raoultibacter sp.]
MSTPLLFGSYYAGTSPFHRMDPRAKLLLSCSFIVIVLCAHYFAGLGICALFVAAAYLIARIPLGKAFKSIAPLAFIVVVAAALNLFVVQGGAVYFSWLFITISEAGVHSCAFIASRLVLMLLAMSLITMTTTTLDTTEAFERLLGPLNRFGFPAHELAMIMGIALRFLPQFALEAQTIYQAQISRGAAYAHSPFKGGTRMFSSLVIPLFTSAFRHAETLSQAMDARCYHGGPGRTRLHPLRFSSLDAAAAATLGVLLACVIASNIGL